MKVDFDKTAGDYAVYRTQFAPQLLDRLRGLGVGLRDQEILDLGAGTGLFASAIASDGSRVTLADASANLLRQSRSVRRVVASASTLPFDNSTFDVVTAAQCWHWFDRQAAPREILRVLQNDGVLAVVYQTYIPLPGSMAEATEQLILKHKPGWRHANSTGINGQVLRDIQIAGFEKIESFSFDVPIPFTQENWRGFVRTTSPIGASMSSSQILRFDDDHAALLTKWPELLPIPHRVFAVVARKG